MAQRDGTRCGGSRASWVERARCPGPWELGQGVRGAGAGFRRGGRGRGGAGGGASRSVSAGKGAIQAPEGLSRTKANTESPVLPQPCPHILARSYKGPHLKQGVQAVEVSWPSHTCCCGCCCCPRSVAQGLVSFPSLSSPLSHLGPGVEGHQGRFRHSLSSGSVPGLTLVCMSSSSQR